MLERKRWRALAGPADWFHLARVQFYPSRISRLHTHDFAEIFWVEKGQGVHHINGESRKLFPADLIFVRPPDVHRLAVADAQGFTLVNLAFPARVVVELGARLPELSRLHDARSVLPMRRELSSLQLRQLNEEVSRLAAGGRGRLPLERFLLGLYALVLVEAEHRTSGVVPDWLAHACAALQRPEHFSRGVSALVAFAGRSPEYVARACRRFMGVSPTEYVNRLRMEHAARELRLGSKPIVEISLECGINNLAHFYALFRAAHRQTPRRYRNEHQRTIV